MSKRKDRIRSGALYESVLEIARRPEPSAPDGNESAPFNPVNPAHEAGPIPDELLAATSDFGGLRSDSGAGPRELPKMKKFRFQLLSHWITEHVTPGRVADIGGGKGLLAYLLNGAGWRATVIDPLSQPLPTKYRDLSTGRQVRIPATERVNRIAAPFRPELAQDFDLLVALHAHGCNIQILETAAALERAALLLPCCIIGEPLTPPPGVHWLQSVADHAKGLGLDVTPFRLNFKGQNIGLYARPASSPMALSLPTPPPSAAD